MNGTGFAAADISVVLAHFLEEDLRSGPDELRGLMQRAPQQAQEELVQLLVSRSGQLCARISTDKETNLRRLLADSGYLARVAEMAWQRLRAGADAPALRIAPESLSAESISELLPGDINFALIFAAEAIYFQDALETFHADERRWRDLGGSATKSRRPVINIFAVHLDWLVHGGKTRRALVVDGTGMAEEVTFESPLPVHAAEIVHLPIEGEQELHRRLSDYCARHHILEVNPYPSAERADSKFWAHTLWRERGIATPKAWLVERSVSPRRIVPFLRDALEQMRTRERKTALYVQPNRGTEGRGVVRLEVDPREIERLGCAHPAVTAIERLLSEDDVLLREERGNVRFRWPEDGGLRRVAFRVHVAWNGRRFAAESGFAQVAADETAAAASRGRGGIVVGLVTAMRSLHRRGRSRWTPVVPSRDDLERMKRAAIAAAEAINADLREEELLKHLGIDLVLEFGRGRLEPVVMEANARPAGLTHAADLEGLPAAHASFTIGTALFDFLSERAGNAGDFRTVAATPVFAGGNQ